MSGAAPPPTIEWRQEHIHRYSAHATYVTAKVRRATWQEDGWQCRDLWGGGHDILLVACRVRLIEGGDS